jgi:hypothetical protein
VGPLTSPSRPARRMRSALPAAAGLRRPTVGDGEGGGAVEGVAAVLRPPPSGKIAEASPSRGRRPWSPRPRAVYRAGRECAWSNAWTTAPCGLGPCACQPPMESACGSGGCLLLATRAGTVTMPFDDATVDSGGFQPPARHWREQSDPSQTNGRTRDTPRGAGEDASSVSLGDTAGQRGCGGVRRQGLEPRTR